LQQFIADWRNIALAIASVVIILLLVANAGRSGGEAKVVRIADKIIYEKDVVNELKRRSGDEVLMKMISDDLIENYAAQQKVTVSDAEIDQIINMQRFSMALEGQNFDKQLSDNGVSLTDVHNELLPSVLSIKLVIPEKAIKAEIARMMAKHDTTFLLPNRFQTHIFFYSSLEEAQKAIKLLQKPGGEKEAALTAQNPRELPALQEYMIVPGYRTMYSSHPDGRREGISPCAAGSQSLSRGETDRCEPRHSRRAIYAAEG
jgi:hypothetical protein